MDNYARSKILKMLEDGKITSDEALKLIEAIDDEAVTEEKSTEKNNGDSRADHFEEQFEVKIDYLKDEAVELEVQADELEGQADELEGQADELEGQADELEGQADELEETVNSVEEEGIKEEAEKLRGKAEKFREQADETREQADEARDKANETRDQAEEKQDESEEYLDRFEKAGKNIDDFADRMTQKINKKIDGIDFGKFESGFFDFNSFGFSIKDAVVKEKCFSVKEGYDISIKNKNGKIAVKQCKEQAHAKFYIKSKKDADEVVNDIEINNEGKLDIRLLFDEKEYFRSRTRVDVELFLPDKQYNDMMFGTTNGGVEVNTAMGHELLVKTTNGKVNIYDCTFKEVNGKTTNGGVSGYRNSCKTINLVTTNGSAKAGENDCIELNVRTTNGSVNGHDNQSENICFATTNGNIKSFRNSADLHELKTSNAGIRIEGFEPVNDEAKITCKTTNGSVKVTNLKDVRTEFKVVTNKNQKVKGDFDDIETNSGISVGVVKKGSNGSKKVLMDIKTSFGNVEFM